MRDGHDVHVFEFRAGFAPIAMRQDVMPPDLSARFNFASVWHRPMEERVEARYAHPFFRWLYVFEERRKPANDLTRVQSLRRLAEFLQRNAGFFRARFPGCGANFLRFEFALERNQNFPFALAQ